MEEDESVMMGNIRTDKADPIELFVKEYVCDHKITHRFRWGGDAMNKLQFEVISKQITITVDDMKDKIKAFVQPDMMI